HVFGRSYILAPSGSGIEGYAGIGVADPEGVTRLDIDIVEAHGGAFRTSYDIWVQKTDWTVDHIWIPEPTPTPEPEPGATPPPPPPPPPPDEGPLLPGIYAGRSARKWQPGWGHPLGEEFEVTGYFGEQRSFNGGPVQGHHGGTDFGANFGTPILATNDGVVVMSDLYLVRGNIVAVDHGAGIFSLYGHMQERAVAVGDRVTKGSVLGYVGSTGLSTGAHLHWEMSVGSVLVDGLRWLDGSQGF
ncbi:MAG: M23 family metallopeptidase, partial [Dehalococcoidia bacterium]|nr:M23 family metallopeptidase [Dehalococcoidia bacterium]